MASFDAPTFPTLHSPGFLLTIDFDHWTGPVPKQHDCFRVDPIGFDAIMDRLRQAGVAYRSLPHGPDDCTVSPAFGGRLVYWSEPDGQVWELLTVSYGREPESPGERSVG
jgi:hypothetical protein